MNELFSASVVLVRPRNPVNIGSAARVMANFGFSDLRVVAPYPPVWRETVSAVNAEDIVLKARLFDELAPAVEDCQLVLGTTCVKDRRLERAHVLLPELAPFLQKRSGGAPLRVALVFGSEKTGLANEHLALCQAVLVAPTSARTPSMNLAQAVAVCCYELSKYAPPERRPLRAAPHALPSAGALRAAAVRLALLMDRASFANRLSPARRLDKAAALLNRLAFNTETLAELDALVKRVNGLLPERMPGTKKL